MKPSTVICALAGVGLIALGWLGDGPWLATFGCFLLGTYLIAAAVRQHFNTYWRPRKDLK